MKYGTHAEYINEHGVEVPSATTVLKILNKPSLVKWANYLGFKRQNVGEVLDIASTVGTTVHSMIYAYLMKKYYIWVGGIKCGKKLAMMHMNSFIEWKNTHDVNPIFMEKKLVSEKFGGTMDFYGDVDNKKTILDFKTSKKPYSSMFLQLAAYCMMLESSGYEVEQVGIIIVNADKYDEKFISRKELERYIESFNVLVDLFHNWYDLNQDDGWGSIL